MIFGISTVSPPSPQSSFRTISIIPKLPVYSLAVNPCSHPLPLGNHFYFLSLYMSLLWTFHINYIIQYIVFCAWPFSVSIMFLRLVYVVHASVLHSFLLSNWFYCIELLYVVYPFTSWLTLKLSPIFSK